MQCPKCASTHIRKNGRQRSKQNYICVPCGRQFIDSYESKGYSEEFKLECARNVRQWLWFSCNRTS